MGKRLFIVIWLILAVMPLFAFWPARCADASFSGNDFFSAPSQDTIFQIDTVYQYEYVYDTIYYYDTLPEADTAFSVNESIEETDSATIVKKTLDVVITENRTVYLDKNNIPKFEGREFRDVEEGEIPDVDFKPPKEKRSRTGISKKPRVNTDAKPPGEVDLFVPVRGRRDTLYRFDTIINFRFRNDTVYFEKRPRSDTVITSRTTYEDFGRSVLVKETVSMKITERQNVFQNKSNKSGKNPVDIENSRRSKRSTKIVPSKYRNSFESTPRVGKDHTYSGSLRLAVSWFEPSITYDARSSEYAGQVDQMNKNHRGESSNGMSFTYQYFRDKTGIESGLAFSRQNFACDYLYQKVVTDTSTYYDYFQREDYIYDTTWYIDLDYLLQTGDTLLIPDVDSTAITVTDSTEKIRVDSSFVDQIEKHTYNFSFLEIPLIAHYKLIDQKFYAHISAGFIPMFMISKSGRFSYPESDMLINAEDIEFDYGFMLSFYGSAVIGYKFEKRWSIFAEPYIRRNLFSVIQNEMVEVKINSWGIKAGIAYRLFKVQSK